MNELHTCIVTQRVYLHCTLIFHNLTLELYKLGSGIKWVMLSGNTADKKGCIVHSRASTTWEAFSVQSMKMMAFSGSLTLKRTRFKNILLLWNFQNTDGVQTGTQLNCHRQAAWRAEKQVCIVAEAKLQDAMLGICHGRRPDADLELPWRII